MMEERDDYVHSVSENMEDPFQFETDSTLERREPSVLVYAPKRMSDQDRSKKRKKNRPNYLLSAHKESPAMAAKGCVRCIYNVAVVAVILEVVLTLVIHIFAWYDHELEGLDWFLATVRGRAWDAIDCLMEVPWVFWIWLVILLLQLLWLLYGITLTWRKSKTGFLFEDMSSMPMAFYFLFFLGVGGNVAWYFVWGRLGHVQWAALTLSLSALVLLFALALSVTALMEGERNMRELGHTADVRLTQVFVHNGVAVYATWLSIVTMYNVGLLLRMAELLKGDYPCSVSLGLIMAYMLVWFVVDMVTKRRLALVFLPYFLVIVVFASALVRNIRKQGTTGYFDKDMLNVTLSGLFLGVTGLFLVVKMFVVICKLRLKDKSVDERSLHDENVYVMQ